MQSRNIRADSLVGQPFHDLVSSGLLSLVEWRDEQGDSQYVYELGENKIAVDYLDRLQQKIKRVAKSKTAPWREVRILGHRRYLLSRQADSLWHTLRGADVAEKAWGREDKMAPYVSIGLRLARKWEPRLREFTNSQSDLLIAEEYPRRMIAHIVSVIRRVCNSKEFTDRVKLLERQQQDNFASCRKYFLSILRVHARPLVMRADLYVKGQAKTAAAEGKIEKAVEKFIRNLREDRIIKDVLGYIVKREDAYDTGIHFHLMTIVDGDKHFKSYTLTQALINHWVYDCVGSDTLASGFNCYLRKDEYHYDGIGLVHYTDALKLMGVRDAIDYMMKTDGHFLVPKSFGKNMRKGHAPRPQADDKRRGAPRKLGNDVSVAERILLPKQEHLARCSLRTIAMDTLSTIATRQSVDSP